MTRLRNTCLSPTVLLLLSASSLMACGGDDRDATLLDGPPDVAADSWSSLRRVSDRASRSGAGRPERRTEQRSR